MQRLGDMMPPLPPRPDTSQPSDPDEAKYSLVMHGLCKKYDVRKPLERHIFSIIENMSRSGRLCLYPPAKLVTYSGGDISEVETALHDLESRQLIERARMKSTNGWKLTGHVRESAKHFKVLIDRTNRQRSHN